MEFNEWCRLLAALIVLTVVIYECVDFYRCKEWR